MLELMFGVDPLPEEAEPEGDVPPEDAPSEEFSIVVTGVETEVESADPWF